MPIKISRENLMEVRERYQESTKGQKTLILNEFCQVCKYQRKYAIRILRGRVTPRVQTPGPKPKYRGEVVKALPELWHLMNQMCSKKMVAVIPLWLHSVSRSLTGSVSDTLTADGEFKSILLVSLTESCASLPKLVPSRIDGSPQLIDLSNFCCMDQRN